MSYKLNLAKLVQDLRGPKGVTALTDEVHRLSEEVNHFKGNLKKKFDTTLKPEAAARIKNAQARFRQLEALLAKNQKAFEKEFKQVIARVRTQAVQAEKDARKILKGQAAKSSKKKAAKRTTKKTSSTQA